MTTNTEPTEDNLLCVWNAGTDDWVIPPRTNEQNLKVMERGGMPWLSDCAVSVFRKMLELPGISFEYGSAAYSAVVAYRQLANEFGKRPRYSRGKCFRALQELESFGLIDPACSGSKFGGSVTKLSQCWRLHGPRPETPATPANPKSRCKGELKGERSLA